MAFDVRGKVEDEDFVCCRLCDYKAETLAAHLKKHGLNADEYRAQFPGALIRSTALTAKRSAAKKKASAEHSMKGKTKTIECPLCKEPREVGWSFSPTIHDARCDACREAVKSELELAKWQGKEEGLDYVICKGCGYRAENLTSHVQNAHPQWVGCYPSQMVAFNSSVRDKTALKGKSVSDETRSKMIASAGWNRGLTKETDERVANAASAMRGRIAWSKGLTKEEHPSLKSTSEKLSGYKGVLRPWSNGLKADLSDVDFTPYLDETGAVDRKTMAEALGLDEVTVTKYMSSFGLRLSTKYVDARVSEMVTSGKFIEMSLKSAEHTTIRLSEEQLFPFRLGQKHDGKLVIAKAMAGLGHVYAVIRRECDRLGVPTYTGLVRQTLCLEAVSKALGVVPYEQEWRSRKFRTAKGNFYRFDGYFPTHDLVVEFHGYQHWTFPSVFIKREDLYLALQERDRIKQDLISDDPVLRYFLVREDEPYADVSYLRERLMDEGVFDPGK